MYCITPPVNVEPRHALQELVALSCSDAAPGGSSESAGPPAPAVARRAAVCGGCDDDDDDDDDADGAVGAERRLPTETLLAALARLDAPRRAALSESSWRRIAAQAAAAYPGFSGHGGGWGDVGTREFECVVRSELQREAERRVAAAAAQLRAVSARGAVAAAAAAAAAADSAAG